MTNPVNARPVLTVEEQLRVTACQDLFIEALRRYKEQNERRDLNQTSMEIVKLALVTLKQNGFTMAEIVEAMS